MADDVLTMAAQIQDRFSQPIKEMQRNLRAFVASGEKGHKDGVQLAKKHEEGFRKLREMVRATTESFKSGFEPKLEGLGVSALSAGLGVASITAAIGAAGAAALSFAGQMRDMRNLSRDTGLPVNELREWLELAPRIGSSAQAMSSGLEGVATVMEKLHRGGGAAASAMALFAGSPQMQGFVATLKDLPRAEQIHKIVEEATAIAKIDPAQSRRFLEVFKLPPEFAYETMQEVDDYLAAIKKLERPVSPGDQERGVVLANAVDNLKTSLKGLSDEIGSDFEPELLKAITGTTDFLKGAAERIHEYSTSFSDDVGGAWDRIKAINASKGRDTQGDLNNIMTGIKQAMSVDLSFGLAGAADEKAGAGLDKLREWLGWSKDWHEDLGRVLKDWSNLTDEIRGLGDNKIDWRVIGNTSGLATSLEEIKDAWAGAFNWIEGNVGAALDILIEHIGRKAAELKALITGLFSGSQEPLRPPTRGEPGAHPAIQGAPMPGSSTRQPFALRTGRICAAQAAAGQRPTRSTSSRSAHARASMTA